MSRPGFKRVEPFNPTQTQGGASNGGAIGTAGGNGSITITYYA